MILPSDSNGVYALPAGYLAVGGEVILPSEHNPPFEDIASGLTARLMRSGAGGMTGQLKLTDGTAGAPSLTFGSALTMGAYKTATGIGFAVSGALVAEIGPSGFIISDKAVTLAKLYHPTATSRLLGSDSNAALVITGAAASAGLIRLSVASTATFATGQVKTVSDVLGTTEANGTWTITVVDAAHIDLQGSTFINAYVSGGTIGGGVEEISLGTGLLLTGSVLKAPGLPIQGSFKNLSIKVTSNTAISVVGDSVIITNGTDFASISPSGAALNMATTGVNGLDTGSIAAGTWYSIWAIWNGVAANQGNLASLSATGPTMPSGYTYKARIGWVRTAAGSAQLMGTWQLGRRAQYVVGLAQTTVLPVLANTIQTIWTSLSVASLVPSTASMIGVTATGNGNTVDVAPNTSYSTTFNSNASYPIRITTAGNIGSAWFMLESTSIAVGLGGSNCNVSILGWEDNL